MRLWPYIMMASAFCLYMSVKTLHDPNGDALLWLLGAPFVFLIGVLFKVVKEDNELAAKNPEYVRTLDLLIPILIIRFWRPAILVILVMCIWLFRK